MKRLTVLQKFFKGGQAESEREIIEDIFVVPNNISEISDFVFANYKIVCAPKGAGKSILLSYLNSFYLNTNTASLIIDPKSLQCDNILSKKTNSEKTKEAERQLLALIGAKIGESISVAVCDADVNLSKAWEDQKGRPTAISRVRAFFTALVPKEYKTIVEAFSNIQDLNLNKKALREDISSHLAKTDKKFVLMIDNIDWAVEEKNQKFDYTTCWAIIEAAIDLANNMNEIAVLVSVRTDVWHTMTKVKNLGSSIQDKIPSPYHLKTDESAIRLIFNRRLATCKKALKTTDSPLCTFFEQEWICLGKAEVSRTWDHWIAKNSRNRPRDMVHLMQDLIMACKTRTKNDDCKISIVDLRKVYEPYSYKILENMESEYFQICPNFKNVFRHFEAKTRYTFKEINQLLQKIASEPLQIDGKALQPGDQRDAIKILRLLHMASFINPRVEVTKETGEYEHVLFEENPDFIDPGNPNKLQNVIFEVHPTFHEIVKNRFQNAR